jgi:hypothetical protein
MFAAFDEVKVEIMKRNIKIGTILMKKQVLNEEFL